MRVSFLILSGLHVVGLNKLCSLFYPNNEAAILVVKTLARKGTHSSIAGVGSDSEILLFQRALGSICIFMASFLLYGGLSPAYGDYRLVGDFHS